MNVYQKCLVPENIHTNPKEIPWGSGPQTPLWEGYRYSLEQHHFKAGELALLYNNKLKFI